MLAEVLDYLKKWFVNSYESQKFKIVTDGIEGSFTETYIAGQYVSIDCSVLNDGVYKILSVTSSKLTLDATLLEEEVNYIQLWGLAVPKAIIDLSTEISTHVDNSSDGIASESQGNRSISYLTDSSWMSVFGKRLAPYRSLTSDKRNFLYDYNINTKRW